MFNFRKKKKPIPGTRTSPQTGQVITSSGNPSLDVILGGGLPIGSICLIEEDKYVTHSKVLAKYFLAEGILARHCVFLGSLDDDPTELLRKLPKPLNKAEVQQEEADAAADVGDAPDSNKNGLRIAWRYNDLPMVSSEQSTSKIGHHFNLLEQMSQYEMGFEQTTVWNDSQEPNIWSQLGEQELKVVASEDKKDDQQDEEIEQAQKPTEDSESIKDVDMENAKNAAGDQTPEAMDFDPNKSEEVLQQQQPQISETKIFKNTKYLGILSEISALLREDKFKPIVPQYKKRLCRICITSLGSPLWYDEHFAMDILKFLTVLRACVLNTTAVCFITMPMHLVTKCDATLVPKIRNLVDFSIELESFAGSERETNPAFRDYSGLLHLHKISAIQTLSAFIPETSDLAFKLRQKKFVIEKLHLPPELEDSNAEDKQTANVPTLSCGSSAGSKSNASLDF